MTTLRVKHISSLLESWMWGGLFHSWLKSTLTCLLAVELKHTESDVQETTQTSWKYPIFTLNLAEINCKNEYKQRLLTLANSWESYRETINDISVPFLFCSGCLSNINLSRYYIWKMWKIQFKLSGAQIASQFLFQIFFGGCSECKLIPLIVLLCSLNFNIFNWDF